MIFKNKKHNSIFYNCKICLSSVSFHRTSLILITIFCMSCKVFTLDTVPYVIDAEFVMEENSTDYSICGVDFYLKNKSEKEIKNITIIFFLFDKDGEPAYECRSKISASVEKSIMPGEVSNFCMSLDQFMNSIPEDPLMLDYLYISEIQYEDDSVWSDPFGLIAFK